MINNFKFWALTIYYFFLDNVNQKYSEFIHVQSLWGLESLYKFSYYRDIKFDKWGCLMKKCNRLYLSLIKHVNNVIYGGKINVYVFFQNVNLIFQGLIIRLWSL